MKCGFLDHEGREHPMIMGCYGLGVGRTAAAAIEQNHDGRGIIWPLPLAPFEVLLVLLNSDQAEVVEAADRLYGQLADAGVDVFYDDRSERPGVKFNDADLIGFPVRVVVGSRGLADGKVEISLRRDGVKRMVNAADAVTEVEQLLAQLRIDVGE
jgi:prolyl-tRNA synthetase